MDWGTVLSITLVIALFIVSTILALKLARKKKPVRAYKSKKIISLGTNAPPELKLTFNDRPVTDVYRTTFIFFNKGNEAIRKSDVTKKITVHFGGAEILREPSVKATSKEEIEFLVKQVVKDGDNAIELDFLYLDHNDGAIVDVIHTTCEQIDCRGNIIGAKEITNIGEFEESRPRFLGLFSITFLIVAVITIPIVILSFLKNICLLEILSVESQQLLAVFLSVHL